MKKSMWLPAVVGVLLVCICTAVVSAQVTDFDPLWDISLEDEIKWYKVTAPGIVVAATKHAVYGMNGDDGSTIWEFACGKEMKGGCFEPLEGTALALITYQKKVRDAAPHVAMIDVRTGEELWNTTGVGLGESYGHFILPPINAILFYGKQAEKPRKKFVAVVDIVTGEPHWQKREFFKGWEPHLFQRGGRDHLCGNQPPVFDTDSTMILFVNNKSLRKYNLLTGEMIWKTKAKLKAKRVGIFDEKFEKRPCAGTALGYAPMLLSPDGQIIYAAYQNTIGAFQTSDGARLWKNAERLRGVVSDIIGTQEGILTNSFNGEYYEMKMLDAATGKKIWKVPEAKGSIIQQALKTDWSSCTNIIIEDSTLLLAANDDLLRIDLKTGEPEKVGKLDFVERDKPYALEQREDCYLVSGMQSATWFGFDGTQERTIYHEPPYNFTEGLFSLTTSLLLNTIGTRQVSDNATVTFSGDYSSGLDALVMDFDATAETGECFYFLTDDTDDDEPQALVRVSKADGEVLHRIIVDTKQPDYRLTWSEDGLIFKKNKHTLTSYRF